MTIQELLSRVKTSLGITGNYQDDTLTEYIYESLEFLADAGVHPDVLKSDSVIGVVTRGVSDLWNYGSGGTDFSPYFYKRAAQLSYKTPGGGES